MSYIIKNEFIDRNNQKKEIRNIHFEDVSKIRGNLGKFLYETNRENNPFFDSSNNITEGVYIYQTLYNPKKALRVYKDILDYRFTHYNDDKLVSEFIKRQPNIKLTELPSGIVTIDKYIVGQEIPLYKDFPTLEQIFKTKTPKEILNYYKQMILILKELTDNEIIYKDVHSKNFLINPTTDEVKLIDFDETFISLENNKFHYDNMIDNLKTSINRINKYINLNFKLDKEETLEQVEETIMTKKLK